MRILILIASIIVLGGFGGGSAQPDTDFNAPLPNRTETHADHDGHEHQHLDPSQITDEMQVVLVPSELVVGPNRFAVGLFDAEGRMIHDALVHFHYFDLSNPQAPLLESEANAVRLQTPEGLTTIFAHERAFARAGNWGVEVQARFPDGKAAIKRIGFEVTAESQALIAGEQAPALDTPTAKDVNHDLRQLTSATKPNPAFYQLSLAESMASGKPTVLLFATPAFCQTRFCGPAYEIANDLYEGYGDAANFIHVEVFTGMPNPAENNWELAPAMRAFGLHSEPWLYLIGSDGKVAYRVEGLFTQAEVERHLLALLRR
jgi:hypothetical protein